MNLSESLKDLVKQGCFPCIIYRGGGIWRAHVNGTGNYWADGKTPLKALREAMRLWEHAGNPMDGYAATKGV